MSGTERDDIDLATAAEQSSEEDEAQEGNELAEDEDSVENAESGALHIVDENDDDDIDDVELDLNAALDAVEAATDPEADEVVNDALDIDSAIEAEAAAEAADDEETFDDEGEPAEVTPFDDQLESEIESELAEQAAVDEAGTAEGDEAEVDPYAEFRKELKYALGKWYVIHSYAGFEKRVKQNIENRKVSMTMEDYIFQVEVPMEDVVEIKNGQRKLVNRVRIPGYVLVRMDLNEDSWSVVRHTPGVTGFVGNSHNPRPLRFDEAFNMLKSLVQIVEAPAAKGSSTKGKSTARVIPAEIDFEVGETITIKEGSFAGLPGTISEIQPASGKLTVLVSLFERETPVTLGFEQVTKL